MSASWQRWQRLLANPLTAVLTVGLVVGLYWLPKHLGLPIFQRLEATSYDLRLILESRTRPVPQSPEIALLEIDNGSLEVFGRWPWPRQIWADVVEQLTELGAHAIFFDVAFPDPARDNIRTRDGREALPEAMSRSINFARRSIETYLSEGGSRLTTSNSAAVDQGFRSLMAEVQGFMPQPDAVVAGSLRLARRAGVITGGVGTIVRPSKRTEVSLDELREQAFRQIAQAPDRPVDMLGPELLGPLAAERSVLELRRKACLLFATDSSPDLLAPGIDPEVRAHATRYLHSIRRDLIRGWTLSALRGELDDLDVDALFSRAIPPWYLNFTLAPTVVEQALAQKLVERDHLLSLAGLDNLPDLYEARSFSLPTFTIARGYQFLGADNEIKDADGVFRSVPLVWGHDGKALPAAGLALYLDLMTGSGSRRAPSLTIEPGPVLAIERVKPGGEPSGETPLRVPLTPSGQMMIHWAGRFNDTFSHVPLGTVLTLVRMKEEREEYFSELSQSDQRYTATRFREAARELTLKDPKRPITLAEITAEVARRNPTLWVQNVSAKGGLLDRVTDPARPRTPPEWLQYFSALVTEIEEGVFSGLKMMLEMLAKEPDAAKRAEREKKYAKKLEPYNRHVKRVNALREELAQRVRGKICMIGHTASSSTDLAPIPFEPAYPKVGSYANVLNTLLTERFIYRPNLLAWSLGGIVDTGSLQLPILILVCVAFAYTLSGLSSARGFMCATLFGVGWVVAVSALQILSGVWIDMVAPILGSSITYILVVTLRNRRTERVRSMFESYVDPRIVKVVVEDESRWMELGGHESRITAFFSDIANFTTLSEMLSPQEVSQMLTDYLSPMTDIILAHDGTRDKYIGDAIVAFFGAPLPTEAHELQACLASIEQQERLIELKKKWLTDRVSWYGKLLAAGTDLTFRIGLNTGQAKVGNFGSLTSKNYTMIGDSVNLASRLEGANKEYGTLIMASEATVGQHRTKLVVRELDRLIVKGRREAVQVHEVIGRTGQVAAHWSELLELYESALGDYHRREFARARDILLRMREKWPGDGPTRVYIERCEAFLAAPPPDDWDGSFKMTHK